MLLVEHTTTPDADLPVEALKDHLRLGTGFAEADIQDEMLVGYLRAALAAIEGATGKALFQRTFSWTTASWRDMSQQVLPVAPILGITELCIIDRNENVEIVPTDRYALIEDVHRPRLVATGFFLPTIPVGGKAKVTVVAGYATDWPSMPHDVALAVIALAASYYENRGGTTPQDHERLPNQVAALLQRYREMRLFKGMR
ncbi:MAG TPA: hypothetical protein DEO85_03420 [Maritimibacter sp.]|nr:hypothetical protein [Maritimibacter sp.]